MKKKKIPPSLLLTLIFCLSILSHYLFDPWGFYWKVSDEEAKLRLHYIQTAQTYLGVNESDGSHVQILQIYNTHEPLPQGYIVQEADSWCAAFVSAMAIRCNITNIVPTECSCERQIGLFQERGCWIEEDSYIPLPGDLIFYDWNAHKQGDSTGWADHVGIVVGTKWPFVKVIEGNKDDCVSYRIIPLGHMHIRGYAAPDFSGISSLTPKHAALPK